MNYEGARHDKQGTDKDVREQAATELPTLRMHLQLGVQLRAKVSC